jgi:hypothetical protein
MEMRGDRKREGKKAGEEDAKEETKTKSDAENM